jgi:hypothetical protein
MNLIVHSFRTRIRQAPAGSPDDRGLAGSGRISEEYLAEAVSYRDEVSKM